METGRLQQVEELFRAALERGPAERAAFLESACGPDAELRHEVDSLLAADAGAAASLEAAVREALGSMEEEIPPVEGQRIGPYQVVRLIGWGGMGEVVLAVRADGMYQKQVAVKLVKRGMDTDLLLRRFRQERQILARLEHPHIAHLLDGGATVDGRPYLVMDYIEGDPITRYCDDRKLGQRQRLELFRQVCSAVQYAHQNLVVHRDLKPGNILVTKAGEPKLLDFGVAKLIRPEAEDGEGAATLTEIRALTPMYASPEQVLGEPVTTASDVYTLGAILYELLTGERAHAFAASTEPEIRRTICETDPARHLPGDLDNIVRMAMRKDPKRRYASVDQLSEDIRRYLEGLPVLARKDTVGYRAGKFLSRHRFGVAAAAIVVLTLVAGIVATIRQARIAEHRFQDVRELAHSVVFELHDAIQDLPGSTAARKLLVQRALEYLDRLAQQASNDRQLQSELAAAYQKVGDVQGNPYRANLGDAPAAIASYRKSLAIRETLAAAVPSDPASQSALASAHTSLGDLMSSSDLAGAVEHYLKAIGIYSALLASDSTNRRIQEDLAGVLIRCGEKQLTTGNTREALANYSKAVEALEEVTRAEPENRKALRGKSGAHIRLGMVFLEAADPPAALAEFEKAKDIRARLAAADPTNATSKRDLWASYNAVGDVLGNPFLPNLGRREESLSYYRRALAISESLAQADPKNFRARRDISVTLARIGDVLKANNDPAGALATYRRALALTETLQGVNPHEFQLKRDQGIVLERIASALVLRGNRSAALEAFGRASRFQENLAAANPRNSTARQDWLETEMRWGEYLRISGDLSGAADHFRRGRGEAEKMLATDPASASSQRLAAGFAEKLGDCFAALASAKGVSPAQRASGWREAGALYRRSSELTAGLAQQSPTPEHRKTAAELSRKLGVTERMLAETQSGLRLR